MAIRAHLRRRKQCRGRAAAVASSTRCWRWRSYSAFCCWSAHSALRGSRLSTPTHSDFWAGSGRPWGSTGADARHLLGSDQLGRDLLSRCLHGLRLTLLIALLGSLMGLLLGGLAGLLSGLFGGIVDALIMGLCDVKIAMPFTLVALLVIAIAGTSTPVLICVLGFAYWAHLARLIRAQVLALRDLPYVEAARAAGASGWRIATRHVMPNIVSPVIVMADAQPLEFDPARNRAVVPRARRAAADRDAGLDGRPGPRLHGDRAVDRGRTGCC